MPMLGAWLSSILTFTPFPHLLTSSLVPLLLPCPVCVCVCALCAHALIITDLWTSLTVCRYDSTSKYAFIADFSGQITVLKLELNGSQFITTLRGHQSEWVCLYACVTACECGRGREGVAPYVTPSRKRGAFPAKVHSWLWVLIGPNSTPKVSSSKISTNLTSHLCKCDSNPPATRAATRQQRRLGELPWPLAAAWLWSNIRQNIVHVYLLPVVYGDSGHFATELK